MPPTHTHGNQRSGAGHRLRRVDACRTGAKAGSHRCRHGAEEPSHSGASRMAPFRVGRLPCPPSEWGNSPQEVVPLANRRERVVTKHQRQDGHCPGQEAGSPVAEVGVWLGLRSGAGPRITSQARSRRGVWFKGLRQGAAARLCSNKDSSIAGEQTGQGQGSL